jgi:hypothetical protein
VPLQRERRLASQIKALGHGAEIGRPLVASPNMLNEAAACGNFVHCTKISGLMNFAASQARDGLRSVKIYQVN